MNSGYSIPLSKLISEFSFEEIYVPDPNVPITNPEVNRPGLALAGYFELFEPTRMQIIGKAEHKYLSELSAEDRAFSIRNLMAMHCAAVIVTTGLEVFEDFTRCAEEFSVPLLRTKDTTSSLMASLIASLNLHLAPRITRHGVLVEVYGEGLLLLGDSGVGKSETAIELVKRGHRLISDDAVEIMMVSSHELVGSPPEVLRHYMELRGIGIINVAKLFGMGAVKDSSSIDLIINMVPWRDGEAYDRLGMETQYTEILDVKVPSITIPITPGRNLAVIFEVAAMNNRQKRMGYNAALEFTEQMNQFFASKENG